MTSALVLAGMLVLGGCALVGEEGSGTDPEPPRALTATEKSVVESDNAFGLTLFRKVVQAEGETENTLVSPVSVSMALGMASNGARGETKAAMKEALRKEGLSQEAVNDAYRGLIDLLEGLDASVQVALANSMWFHDGLQVKPAFVDTNRVHFDAEVQTRDFRHPDTRTAINDWVEEATRGNVESILDQPIPKEVVSYLINATYFNGPWRTPFPEENTTQRPFEQADGSTVPVPMMERTEDVTLPAYGNDLFQAVDIPYGDSLYSMTILLPREDASLPEVVDRLDAETWAEMTEGLSPREFSRLRLPRFTLQYEKELKDVLSDMGMGIAFTKRANFLGIADSSPAIDEVRHKTTLEVTEEGTEASAVTSVGIRVTSAPPAFDVNRPFALAIRDRHSGSVLFIGAVGSLRSAAEK